MNIGKYLEERVASFPKLILEWKSSCVEDFVLKYGRDWKILPFPQDYLPGEKSDPFFNAIKLALQEKLTYVEGFSGHTVPTIHAWCIDIRNMAVVDPNWCGVGHRPKLGLQYFGVAFNNDFVLRKIAENGHYGILNHFDSARSMLVGETGFEADLAKY